MVPGTPLVYDVTDVILLPGRLVTISQGTARNHFWEAEMLMQSSIWTLFINLCWTTSALSTLQQMANMQITEVKGQRVHFLFQKLNFDKTMAFFFIFFCIGF